MQKEMMWFLWKKWSIHVHKFIIFRILKKRHWSEKREQCVNIRQNDELRLNWIVDLLQLMIEQLVFIDETLFNKTTKWRHQVYASIDESARYQVFRKREHFWSVLSMYTINDYLLCINIHEDWFNNKTFFAALKLSMICLLKLRKQLTLTAASAVFALTAAFIIILAAMSALTLSAASALCHELRAEWNHSEILILHERWVPFVSGGPHNITDNLTPIIIYNIVQHHLSDLTPLFPTSFE